MRDALAPSLKKEEYSAGTTSILGGRGLEQPLDEGRPAPSSRASERASAPDSTLRGIKSRPRFPMKARAQSPALRALSYISSIRDGRLRADLLY